MCSSTLPVAFDVWNENRKIFAILTRQSSFYAMYLLWQIVTFPDADLESLRGAATRDFGISKSTFQRSLRILKSLNLIESSNKKLEPRKKAKFIVEKLNEIFSIGLAEWHRALDFGTILLV